MRHPSSLGPGIAQGLSRGVRLRCVIRSTSASTRARPALFSTPAFAQRFGERARANLSGAIEQLG